MITLNPVAPGSQPSNGSADYVGTWLRHPALAPLRLPSAAIELAGPRFDPAQFPFEDRVAEPKALAKVTLVNPSQQVS